MVKAKIRANKKKNKKKEEKNDEGEWSNHKMWCQKDQKKKFVNLKNQDKKREPMKTSEKMMNMTGILAQESVIEDVENSSNAWI